MSRRRPFRLAAGFGVSVGAIQRLGCAGTDNVFSDGSSLERATVSGAVASGLVAALSVAV